MGVGKFTIKKRDIIIIALFFSVIMYMAGVFSGLNANKIIESKVNRELNELKKIMDNSALDVKNLQLQELFLNNFEKNSSCRYVNNYLKHTYSQLEYYWSKLPSRLEEYERTSELSNEYTVLKREYTRLSLRVWLVAKKNFEECNNQEFIPILYFYTNTCENCIMQGEQFDAFRENMALQNKTVIVFPIDANFDEDTVYLLKEYYNLTLYPAFVLNNNIIQGEIITAEKMVSIIS